MNEGELNFKKGEEKLQRIRDSCRAVEDKRRAEELSESDRGLIRDQNDDDLPFEEAYWADAAKMCRECYDEKSGNHKLYCPGHGVPGEARHHLPW